jgi:hypothetical protein
MIHSSLFDSPIRKGKIRGDVWYFQYRNGSIDIAGEKYVGYSIREAIKKWREKHPLNEKTKQ